MPSWIPYASNWISCNNWQKTNFEPVPRLLAVGFYVISQPILDFGLSCGTLRERLTSTYLDLPRLTSVQVAQSNDFGLSCGTLRERQLLETLLRSLSRTILDLFHPRKLCGTSR